MIPININAQRRCGSIQSLAISEAFTLFVDHSVGLAELAKRGGFYRVRSVIRSKCSRKRLGGTTEVRAVLVNFGRLMDPTDVRSEFRKMGLKLGGPRELLAWEKTKPLVVVALGHPLRDKWGYCYSLFVYPYGKDRAKARWGLGLQSLGHRWEKETWFLATKEHFPLRGLGQQFTAL